MQVPKLGLPTKLYARLETEGSFESKVEAKSSADEISSLIIDQYLEKSEFCLLSLKGRG
jgi:hypothetical protein